MSTRRAVSALSATACPPPSVPVHAPRGLGRRVQQPAVEHPLRLPPEVRSLQPLVVVLPQPTDLRGGTESQAEKRRLHILRCMFDAVVVVGSRRIHAPGTPVRDGCRFRTPAPAAAICRPRGTPGPCCRARRLRCRPSIPQRGEQTEPVEPSPCADAPRDPETQWQGQRMPISAQRVCARFLV